MESNFTNTTILIRYLDGELESAEKADLETALQQQPDLAAELESLRFAQTAVAAHGLRQQVAAAHRNYKQQVTAAPVVKMKTTHRFRYYAMRVAAVALVAVSLTALYQYMTFSPDNFYQSHYEAYTIGASRGQQDNNPIETAFQQKKYAEVLQLHAALQQSDAAADFYAGIAALETGKLEQSAALLESVAAKNKTAGTSFFSDEADYYLALTYIRQQQVVKALPILEKIRNTPAHLYHNKVSDWDLRKLRWMN